LLDRKKDFLNILLRFIEMPIKDEAEHFGGLEYSDSFNSNRAVDLTGAISPDSATPHESAIPVDDEVRSFIMSSLKNGCYWPQAIIASKYPEYFITCLLESFNNEPVMDVMLSILHEIKTQKLGHGAIFGAAELGRKFLNLASLLSVKIACFVDSDERFHGMLIEGIPVIPLIKAPNDTTYFVIASFAYAEQIHTALQRHYDDSVCKPRVFFMSPK